MNTKINFTASLVFRYRVFGESSQDEVEIVERRLFTCTVEDVTCAEKYFISRGRQCDHFYSNSSGDQVHYEFLGIQEIQGHCSTTYELDEIWRDVLNYADIENTAFAVDLR